MKCLEDYCGQRRWRAWSVMPERIRLTTSGGQSACRGRRGSGTWGAQQHRRKTSVVTVTV